VKLVVTAPPSDFTVAVSPSQLTVHTGACGNLTVTVTSIGNFNSPINLTLTGLPTHVSVQFSSNPLTPPAGGTSTSLLTVCPATTAAPGNYTIVVVGTSGTVVHTANALLQIPGPPPPPPFNSLIFWIVIGMLLLALGLALLAFLLSGKRRRARFVPAPAAIVPPPPILVPARGPTVRYVLPVPTVRCRYCGRVMPLNSVYCPFCGRPQIILAPPVGRLIPARAGGGRKVIAVVLSLLSGILVLLNAAALLAPAFWSTWSAIFFWLPTLGVTYAFILGAIIGLTLVLGAIIMAVGNGALADVIIFPFAIFSLIIGGGFIAGMLIGIVGGILVLVSRNR